MPPDNCDEDLITYNMEIKPIIDTYCAFGTCHADNSDAPGNFTTYAGMQAYLNDDGIKRYCVDLRKDANEGMPPNWAINTGPHDFTDEDFEKIECWINLNYPE